MLGFENANILALSVPEKFNNLFHENFLQQCVSGNWDKLSVIVCIFFIQRKHFPNTQCL